MSISMNDQNLKKINQNLGLKSSSQKEEWNKKKYKIF